MPLKKAAIELMPHSKNVGYKIPGKKITINMAPADFAQKEGSAYDLKHCHWDFGCFRFNKSRKFRKIHHHGRTFFSLDGGLQPIKGVLPIAIKAREEGFKGIILPKQNVREAAIVNNREVYGVENIKQVIDFFNEDIPLERTEFDAKRISRKNRPFSF